MDPNTRRSVFDRIYISNFNGHRVKFKTKSKWGLYTTTIIFNNILNFFVVMLLYLNYFNNKISGTTFICSLVTLVIIYYLIFMYKTIKNSVLFDRICDIRYSFADYYVF